MDAPPFVDQVIVDICFQSTPKGFFCCYCFLINVLALVQESSLLVYLNEVCSDCYFGEKRQIKVLLGYRDRFVLEGLLKQAWGHIWARPRREWGWQCPREPHPFLLWSLLFHSI